MIEQKADMKDMDKLFSELEKKADLHNVERLIRNLEDTLVTT